ncbi:MAG: hypothetical protein ACR2HX_19630 [Pyrinomonadaceae bacterium]
MATHDIDRICAVKENAQGRLLAIPGVHSVGLGAKYVGDQRTREPAIMVFVTRKKPVAELLPHEIIPTEIDGVKTDVIESTPPSLMAADSSRYRPLVGGIQLRGGGSISSGGTLGCIARTNGPVPTIVGITNQHCVGLPSGVSVTGLSASTHFAPPGNDTITFAGAHIRGTLIVVDCALITGISDVGSINRAFYSTRPEDTLEKIAERVANAIKSLPLGISAAPIGPRVILTPPAGFQEIFNARVFGPHGFFDPADLRPSVEGNEITFKGKVTDNYGIFTNWNVGGLVPTAGVYTQVRKGSGLSGVATDIAAAVNGRGLPSINATATGSTVRLTGSQQVECDVSSDVRIGQPSDCFCSICSGCCRDRIGVVLDARIDIDAALIELDGGLQYRAEIEDIGPIKGTHTYLKKDLDKLLGAAPIRVRKRGAATRLTHGVVLAIDQFGEMRGALAADLPHFHRQYSNVISILPDKTFNATFSDRGDSGSAVVNEADEVIGILFGSGTETYVTPIAEIEAAFDLSVVTAEAKGQVNTVPATQGHAFSIVEREPLFVDALRDVERELTATPGGRELAEVGRRHAHEVVQLVNHNRRVGTVWRRNGGPEIVQTALTMAQTGEKDLPRQINGRPLADCLRKMQEILERYGSAQLAADLRRYGPRIIDLTKFDYRQLLAAFAAAPQ